jgi:peptide/nickel transport system ATP-binding protein
MRAYPHQLSGGQRQRAAIAQALVCPPSLLIADEPLSSLDTVTQAELLELFRQLKSELNLSMIFISHDAAALSTVCDRLLVMKTGQVVASGNWEQIRSSTDEYIRGLQFTSAKTCAEAYRRNSVPVLNAAPALEVRNLTKTYVQRHMLSREKFEIRALNDVSFGLKPNTTVAVIGRSGSGKSTLARCIAGFEKADEGEVLFEQKPIKKRSSIQMTFQDAATALNPRFTAAQLVAEPMDIARVGSGKDRIERALDLMAEVGLDKAWHSRNAGEFSGGQRQRLALARALAASPKILIIDESLSGLDLFLQEQILTLLLDLQSRHHLAYLFISHDLRFLPMFAEEVLVMDGGSIVDRVAPSDLCSSSNPVTRVLVQSDEQLHSCRIGARA